VIRLASWLHAVPVMAEMLFVSVVLVFELENLVPRVYHSRCISVVMFCHLNWLLHRILP